MIKASFLLLLVFIITFSISNNYNAATPAKSRLKVIDKKVPYGFKTTQEKRNITSIIIHSSYNALDSDSFSVQGVLKEYDMYKVAPHYLIDREGGVYQLVRDEDIAYHAGKSRLPDGTVNVNQSSIGIEIINTFNSAPSQKQYEALNSLIDELKARYKIRYVLGHSDIAPGRKSDPWMFDWNKVPRVL